MTGLEAADNESGECDSEGGTPHWARPLLSPPTPVFAASHRRSGVGLGGEEQEQEEVRYIGGCEAAEFAAMAADGMLLDLEDTDPEAFDAAEAAEGNRAGAQSGRQGHGQPGQRPPTSTASSTSMRRDGGSDGREGWWERRDRSHTMLPDIHTPLTAVTEQLVQRSAPETSKYFAVCIAAVVLAIILNTRISSPSHSRPRRE
jgi:hypothetical protein